MIDCAVTRLRRGSCQLDHMIGWILRKRLTNKSDQISTRTQISTGMIGILCTSNIKHSLQPVRSKTVRHQAHLAPHRIIGQSSRDQWGSFRRCTCSFTVASISFSLYLRGVGDFLQCRRWIVGGFVGAKVFQGTWSLETLRSFDLAVSIGDIDALRQPVLDCNIPQKSEPLWGRIYTGKQKLHFPFSRFGKFCHTILFLSIRLGKSHFPLSPTCKNLGMCQVLLSWPSDCTNRWREVF